MVSDSQRNDAALVPQEVFQYALLRVVPSLARGEALNVGVVLHCRRRGFLGVATRLDRARLSALDPRLDVEQLERHLLALSRIAEGDETAGALARMDRSERFGWIVAPASTLVQPSPVHTGLCLDPADMLARMAAELLGPPDGPDPTGDRPVRC